MEDVKPPLTEDPTLKSGPNVAKDDIVTLASNGITKRVELPEDQKLEKEKFLELWQEQNQYIDHIEAKLKVRKQTFYPKIIGTAATRSHLPPQGRVLRNY